MEITEIGAGTGITVGEITLLPVVYSHIIYRRTGRGTAGYGTKRPIAIVVTSPQGVFALDMEGKTVPLSQYAGIPGVPQ